MSKVTILVLEDDPGSQTALRQMLDSEGWSVHIASQASVVLPALAKGAWTLVIANLALVGLSGPLFATLKELALAPALEEGKGRLRILFLLPETMGPEAQRMLDADRLPYVVRPFNLHDVLDKVSDLLLEREAIPAPIRRVRFQRGATSRQSRMLHAQRQNHDRGQGMFARDASYTMTEDELEEYEKQEREEEARRRKSNPLGPT